MNAIVFVVMAPFVLAFVALAVAFGSLGAADQATLAAAGEAVQAAAFQLTQPAAAAAATRAATITAAHNCVATTADLSGDFSPGQVITVAVTCRMHPLPLVPQVSLHATESGVVATNQDVSQP